MFSKIFKAQKAKKLITKNWLIDEQKYLMKEIKSRTSRGYNTLLLFNSLSDKAMERRAFNYVKNDEKEWLETLGYQIEVYDEEIVVSWV